MRVRVARVGKAHGLRGEVTVRLHTDDPEDRFAPGTQLLAVDPSDPNQAHPGTALTVDGSRLHNGTWLVGFAQVSDRTAAEALRGRELYLVVEEPNAGGAGTATPGMGADVEAGPDRTPAGLGGAAAEPGWYESELLGLTVFGPDGGRLGRVIGLRVGAAQDLLTVRLDDGREGDVPFVTALVPVVDVPGGRVVIDPPGGLFDLDRR